MATDSAGGVRTLLLLVDDEPTNLDLLQMVVEESDLALRVVTAANGEEAVARAREHLPDLVLMDLKMPGVDGWEAARRLKSDPRTASVPIIALTAQAMPGDRDAALAAGCEDYMAKPVDVRALIALLRARLG